MDHPARHIKVDLSAKKKKNSEPPQELTTDSLRKDELKKSRGGLASSLIGFSIDDVVRTHKVKSEYNTRTVNNNSLGKMFSCLDSTTAVGGMIQDEVMKKEVEDGDNDSVSALSFISGGGVFSPFASSITGLSMSNFNLNNE